MIVSARHRWTRIALLGASGMTLVASAAAMAQTSAPSAPVETQAPAPDTASNPEAAAAVPQSTPPAEAGTTGSPAGEDQDIVVTGIRASLRSATNAKRNSVAFGDSTFA